MELTSLPTGITPETVNGAGAPAPAAAPSAPSAPPSSASPAVVQPAVTVDLSAAALAALAARTSPSDSDAGATDASSASPSAQASAGGAGGVPTIVLQAQRLAGVIADGSTASDADKATALAGLYQLRFKSGGYAASPSSDSWFTQSTQTQRDQINNAVDKSAFFKQAVSAASQFNADGMALARAGQSSDNAQTAYARFNQLSSGQQVLVWAGGASQFGTLEQYSAYLGQQAAVAAPPAPSSSPAGSSPPSASSAQAYQSGQLDTLGSIVSKIA